ncbi:MAG: hypothetical protein M3N21_02565 [Actinomycetota bacterium]|nr:hypothetical protein [Actinomycetota bacterium]
MTIRLLHRRRVLGLVAATGAAAAAFPLLGAPALADAIRTDTSLGGYRVTAIAAPLRVLVDDPAVPIPRPVDAAIVEADPSYTYTTLSTGPTSRAVASSLWPGTLFGDGLTQVAPGAPTYPLKADAAYPDNPHTASGPFPGADAKALGLDVSASARTVTSPVPANLDLGLAESTSSSTVDNGVAVATTVSDVHDVSLLGGLIRVKSVRSELTTRSDGRRPSASGTTTVSGLVINGVGYAVDDQGVRVISPAPVPGVPMPDTSALSQLKALGLTVEPVRQTTTTAGTTAARTATGLRITVDTVVLRGAIDSIPMLNQTLSSVYSQIPPVPGLPVNTQSLLFYTLAASPKLTFILAAGVASSAANLPIVFSFPALPALPPVGAPGAVGGGPGAVGAPGGAALLPSGPGTAPLPTGALASPQVAALLPPTSPAASTAGFQGLGAGILLLSLLVAGAVGRGLVALRAVALGGWTGKGCSLGVPENLPNLRGE